MPVFTSDVQHAACDPPQSPGPHTHQLRPTREGSQEAPTNERSCHSAQSSGGSVKKMLIVPKMQPQSLCEFIKSFNGIRFVVYKWRKEFPTFSVSRDQLERAWTWTTPDTGLTRLYRETGERPPHQSKLCHDFLVTINFLPRPRFFSEEF